MRELKCSRCGKVAVKLQHGSLVDKGCSVMCGACNREVPRKTACGFREFNDLFGKIRK